MQALIHLGAARVQVSRFVSEGQSRCGVVIRTEDGANAVTLLFEDAGHAGQLAADILTQLAAAVQVRV